MENKHQVANILLVDDRPDKLLALETILTGLQQNLVKVRSGDDALRVLLKEDFAVILLDVNMPGLDGFETAALIRQRPRSEATPIIFISAVNDTENHVSRGYSLGAVDYILTPVIPEILRAKVAAFVDLHRKTQQVKRQAEEHAQLLQAQSARVHAEAAKERMAFLAEASNVLAGSLDYHRTFQNLARLIVPRLADFCLIDRLDESGRVAQIAVAHREAGQEELLRRIRYPDLEENDHGAYRVFQTGLPFVCNYIDDETFEDLFPAQDRDLLRSLGPVSFAAVPLHARGRVIGAITMIHTSPGQRFGQNELWVAEELAQRTALALDNVELYRKANQAKEEAEAANLAKDNFLAMLSHELRTPLTPVLTYLIKLESDPSVPGSVKRPLEAIRRNVELEARLIDDLLDLTRVGSGKIHLVKRVVDVHSLLSNALEICRNDMVAKELELSIRFEAPDFHVRADPARLQQVFWNVVKNAVKFTSAGTIEVITLAGPDRQIHIQIRDSGIGMDEALISRVFEPFEQGEEGKAGGLGLGLAIAKALVDLHEGEIHLESAGIGHGTTVRVLLPIVDELPPAPPAKRTTRKAGSSPIRILLVEDHVDTNESLTMLLELSGYSVTSAFDVRSAIEIAKVKEFDVLISDLGLPDGNAGEVMRQVAATSGAPGIALSGLGMEKDLEMSRELGFICHLIKPVDVANLGDAIQHYTTLRKKTPAKP